jgi:threonine/homoserine/homoserine lactone efflux protein
MLPLRRSAAAPQDSKASVPRDNAEGLLHRRFGRGAFGAQPWKADTMQQVLGALMPLALGIAISPIPIIAIILMLITPKARSNGLAFLVGWMAGILIVGGIALVVAGVVGLSTSSDSSSQPEAVIKLVLGMLLLVVAVRQWRTRPKPGEENPLPKWMQALDTFTPGKSLGMAALLSGINPKNLALNLAAMSVVATAGLSTTDQVVALLFVVVIGSISIIAPVVVYFAGGDKSAQVLEGWKVWLSANNNAIMSVLLLVLGVVLIGQGVSGL